MKKLLTFVLASIVMIAGCQVDTSDIDNRIDGLESRVEKLEQLCSEMNANISALQTIVTALENNDFVTSIKPVMENGREIGYKIVFSKSGEITIYHGRDGENGKDGQDGKDGENGKNGQDGKDGQNGRDGQDGKDGIDGKDGHTPMVGVAKGEDGIYYWTLDGEWLLDQDGNKIKAEGRDGKDGKDGADGQDGKNGENGKDGKDGKDGQDGKDGNDGKDGADGHDGKNGENGKDGKDGQNGNTPQLKIEDGYWYVSYNNGENWEKLYKAVGEDGKDGEDGKSFFQSVTYDEHNIYIVLADGTELTIPISSESVIGDLLTLKYVSENADGVTEFIKSEDDDKYTAEFNFMIVPQKVVDELQKSWKDVIEMRAFYTKERDTKSVDLIDLPVIAFVGNPETGVITVTVSGDNLSEDFYKGACTASAYMVVSDGIAGVTSETIKIEAKESMPSVKEFEVNGVKFNMIRVEGGTFKMGATPEQEAYASPNEKPVHDVTLSDYYIGETEVTRELWTAVMGPDQSDNEADAKRPKENISLHDVMYEILPKLNELVKPEGMRFTLPTEAQWEYAARGGNRSKGYIYSGSDNLEEVAWVSTYSSQETHPVGTKKPNELGIFDMSGNVKELCGDLYDDYSSDPQTDPMGPVYGGSALLRGGCITNSLESKMFRVSARECEDYSSLPFFFGIGFRLAMSSSARTLLTLEESEVKDIPSEGESVMMEYLIINPEPHAKLAADCTADWIKDIDLSSDQEIRFTVLPNPGDEPRECVINFLYKDQAVLLKVSQKKNEANLTLSKTEFHFPAGGTWPNYPELEGISEYTIKTPEGDAKPEVTCSANWMSKMWVNSYDGNIGFCAMTNMHDTPRECVLYVKYGSDTKQIKITQDADEPPIEVEGENLLIEANGIHFTMVKVEGGSFNMGATPEQPDFEDGGLSKPVHKVNLDGYYIGECEVSRGLWEAVMGEFPEWSDSDSEVPVSKVNWNTIMNEFIPKLNKITGKNFTLPTEAQWEFAARGGNNSKGYVYSGTDNIDDLKFFHICPVDRGITNELGLYNMSGNVSEWCYDWSDYYSGEEQTNPVVLEETPNGRVVRGAWSYNCSDIYYCVASRQYMDPDYDMEFCDEGACGFRLALNL